MQSLCKLTALILLVVATMAGQKSPVNDPVGTVKSRHFDGCNWVTCYVGGACSSTLVACVKVDEGIRSEGEVLIDNSNLGAWVSPNNIAVDPQAIQISRTAEKLDANQYASIYTKQFRYRNGLVVVDQPAPLEFEWYPQDSQPFPPGFQTGIPQVPGEFRKVGVLVAIENCEGCKAYRVTATYRRRPWESGPDLRESTIVDNREDARGKTYAVVWLGKSRDDHEVLGVEVEALAVVARSAKEANR